MLVLAHEHAVGADAALGATDMSAPRLARWLPKSMTFDSNWSGWWGPVNLWSVVQSMVSYVTHFQRARGMEIHIGRWRFVCFAYRRRGR